MVWETSNAEHREGRLEPRSSAGVGSASLLWRLRVRGRGRERWEILAGANQVAVGEGQVLFPIIRGDVVFAGAEVVADGFADGVIGGWPVFGAEGGAVEEFIDRFGVDGAEEFAFGVGQFVFGGAGDVERAGGDEGEERVLIEWEVVRAIDVVAEFVAVAPGGVGDGVGDVLAEVASGQGRAAFTTIIRDD